MSLHLPQSVDYIAYTPSGVPSLFVEVKKWSPQKRQWATSLHNALIVSHSIPSESAFLLVTPTELYLWQNGSSQPIVIDGKNTLHPFLQEYGQTPESILPESLDWLIGSLLQRICQQEGPPELQRHLGKLLKDTTIHHQ